MWTVDAAHPRATAVAVSGDTIVALGDAKTMTDLRSRSRFGAPPITRAGAIVLLRAQPGLPPKSKA